MGQAGAGRTGVVAARTKRHAKSGGMSRLVAALALPPFFFETAPHLLLGRRARSFCKWSRYSTLYSPKG